MRDPAPWQKRYDYLWIMAVWLGVCGQYLFVGRAAGLSVPLFVTLFYGLFFYAARGRIGGFDRWRGQSKTGWLLLVPIGLLAMTYMLFANEWFRFFNSIVLFIFIVAQTMLLTRGSSQPWHRPRFLIEHLIQWLVAPLAHLATPFDIMAGWVQFNKNKRGAHSRLGKIGFGLLLAAPLLFIIVVLLASSDGIFQYWLNRMTAIWDNRAFGEGLGRLIVGASISLYTFCYLWGLLFRKRAQQAVAITGLSANQQAVNLALGGRPTLDPITAATVLICVNLVYVLFAMIQFTYLFGAADGLLPTDMAYAEYARRGFAELVFIAVINIGILLIGLHFIAPGNTALERLRKALLSLLMGNTLVMLVSAYSRLSLYEEAYGYTQLRLVVHGFMILLGLLIAVALVRIWYQWFSLAKIYIAMFIAAYLVINYANIDARIVIKNSERFQETGEIDLDYLRTLSADAGPALMKLHKEHPELEGLDHLIEKYKWQAHERGHWQSWNLSWEKMNGK